MINCLCLFLFASVYAQDDEFNEIIKSAEKIEYIYGHLFDEVLINDDLPKAFERLFKIGRKVESEPLWVPSSWVQ